MGEEPMKKLTEDGFTGIVMRVKHTSSPRCDESELTEVADDDGEKRKLRLTFKDRPNKCLRVLYIAVRMFYTAIYFYFFPIFAILIGALIPVLTRPEGSMIVCE